MAVLVNDMAAVNIDSQLVSNTRLLQREAKMVELHNGCICCTLREDLVKELGDLAAEGKYDAIVVESTGVSDPKEVAETFAVEVPEMGDAEGEGEGNAPQDWELESIHKALRGKSSLNEVAQLDTCVTCVDVAAFDSNLTTGKELQERFKGSADEGDDRGVAPLLMSQIEFADVIVLTKCDLLSAAEVAGVEGSVRALNPGAKVVRALQGDVTLSQVLRTGLFSMEKASMAPGWLQKMNDVAIPETEVYGIGSFVYKSRTPFHPLRLLNFMDDHFVVWMDDHSQDDEAEGMESEGGANEVCALDAAGDGGAGAQDDAEAEEAERERDAKEKTARSRRAFGNIMRSKGYMWLAGRDAQMAEWSQAGAVGTFNCGGGWMSSLPPEFWPEEGTDIYARVMKDFAGPDIKDRRQEVVIIGQNLKQDAIVAALDACLLKKEDLVRRRDRSASVSENAWMLDVQGLEDPFPHWPELSFD